MLAICLPSDIEARLDDLAKRMGRTKTFYVRQAIIEHLSDIEDVYLAESRLEDLRAGKSQSFALGVFVAGAVDIGGEGRVLLHPVDDARGQGVGGERKTLPTRSLWRRARSMPRMPPSLQPTRSSWVGPPTS